MQLNISLCELEFAIILVIVNFNIVNLGLVEKEIALALSHWCRASVV